MVAVRNLFRIVFEALIVKKIILKVFLKLNIPEEDCEGRALGESTLYGQLYMIAWRVCKLCENIAQSETFCF